ncbi:MAG: sel1 repeat family protein, partial [Rhodospirillaceae bacterium]|nr:sel1 repeat family protein [Rhodospirillaceae bacterium]
MVEPPILTRAIIRIVCPPSVMPSVGAMVVAQLPTHRVFVLLVMNAALICQARLPAQYVPRGEGRCQGRVASLKTIAQPLVIQPQGALNSPMLRRVSIGLVLVFLAVHPTQARDFLDGHAAYKRGDYNLALIILRPLAEKGNARAQNDLAVMSLKGRGVPQDVSGAAAWFRKAAEQGLATAQNNLAVMYRKGQGVPQDFGKAVAWTRKAAEQGHARAQNNLAVMYLRGEGVPRDEAKAMNWFRKAAEQGYARAENNFLILMEKRRAMAPVSPPPKVQPSMGAEKKPVAVVAPIAPIAAVIPVVPVARGAFRIQLGALKRKAVAEKEAARLSI